MSKMQHHVLHSSVFIQIRLLGRVQKLKSICISNLMHSGKHLRVPFFFFHFQLQTSHFFLLEEAREPHGTTHEAGFLAKITLLRALGDNKLLSAVDFLREPLPIPAPLPPPLSTDGAGASSTEAAPGGSGLGSLHAGRAAAALLQSSCSTSIFTTGAVWVA